jgi:hypothetical protein
MQHRRIITALSAAIILSLIFAGYRALKDEETREREAYSTIQRIKQMGGRVAPDKGDKMHTETVIISFAEINIADDDVKVLRGLQGCYHINLDLSRTPITDRGLELLTDLPVNWVGLSGTHVTDDGVNRLRTAKPDIMIDRGDQ